MTKTANELIMLHCRGLEGSAMGGDAVKAQLDALPDWSTDGKRIRRRYAFSNYWETIAFVNALAYVIHREDHHPELTIGYDRIDVAFDTHSVGGISENDFICAAKCDALFAARPIPAEQPRAPSA